MGFLSVGWTKQDICSGYREPWESRQNLFSISCHFSDTVTDNLQINR